MIVLLLILNLVLFVNGLRLPEQLIWDSATHPELVALTKESAAQIARTLVYRESLVNVNTLSSKDGIPISAMEYYADCDGDGDPYWLIVDIGQTYQNIKEGLPYSFTIRAGDHPVNDEVDMNYPGGILNSPAGSPRLNLRGEIVNLSISNPLDLLKLEKCFLKRHPDAKWWLPTNAISPHRSHWVKIAISEVYMIGGFGDRAFIGTIDGALYHDSDILK